MEYSVDYIQVLIDSLKKKSAVLDRISELNEEQKQLAATGKVDLEEFQKTLDGKQDCIDELNKLDEGFELVYERVKPELVDNAENHKDAIILLKRLISEITDKSMHVQTEEERNRQMIAAQYATYKKEIRQYKMGRNVTTSYYNSMNKLQNVEPVFMDKKK